MTDMYLARIGKAVFPVLTFQGHPEGAEWVMHKLTAEHGVGQGLGDAFVRVRLWIGGGYSVSIDQATQHCLPRAFFFCHTRTIRSDHQLAYRRK